MNINLGNLTLDDIQAMGHKTVVSLRTERYKKGNTFVESKVLKTLKRKSKGFDILNDCIAYEIEDLAYIRNLYMVADGEYELLYNNPSRDSETGVWDFDGYILLELVEDE